MKALLFFYLFAGGFFCNGMKETVSVHSENEKTINTGNDSPRFTLHVQPILEKNCSPCHFPGGKMYDKLPFDDSTTLLNHQEGILKRIKKEDENAVLKKFISENEK
jgi:hypothetical protein